MHQTFEVQTSAKTDLIDITRLVQEAVRKTKVGDGVCIVFVPHTTAGITINENADPAVASDIVTMFNKIVPNQGSYQHLEGNSPAHIKASVMGFSQTVLVASGKLVLGTWQAIFFCEFDGPRSRKVHVNVMQG